jgi:hypothetical protein
MGQYPGFYCTNYCLDLDYLCSLVTMSINGSSEVLVAVEHTLIEAGQNLGAPDEVPVYKFVFTSGPPCGGN